MNKIDQQIQQIKTELQITTQQGLSGYCFVFAQKLQEKLSGVLRYLNLEQHVVLDYEGKLYDITGNVTKQYKGSKYLTEEQLLNRSKLLNTFVLLTE